MTEDELLAGLTDALTLAGWRWTHIRRSDGVTMGASGLPDLIAAHPSRNDAIAWELKDAHRQPTFEQAAWLSSLRGRIIDAALIRPADYDAALRFILAPVTDPAVESIRAVREAGEIARANWPVDHAEGE